MPPPVKNREELCPLAQNIRILPGGHATFSVVFVIRFLCQGKEETMTEKDRLRKEADSLDAKAWTAINSGLPELAEKLGYLAQLKREEADAIEE